MLSPSARFGARRHRKPGPTTSRCPAPVCVPSNGAQGQIVKLTAFVRPVVNASFGSR